MSDFMVRAVLAGIGVALAAGPLGCFVVWRRMAYFGDTLSHAGLTGIALGLIAGIGPTAGMIAMGVALSLALFLLERQHRVPSDTILGILSHASLAVGLIAFAFLDRVRVDLLGYLFGDILAVTRADVFGIYIGAAIALLGLVAIWRPMVTLTVHADMAQAEGIAVERVRFLFTLLVALSVAVAMKVVGILLVTAMLIVPAAAMRPLARSPEAMAVGSAVIGVLAVFGGMAASLAWDLPSGPAIVAAAVLLFVLTAVVGLTGLNDATTTRNGAFPS
ncbi:MAG: iron chelate uptake ABC transporter family permease subunit [Ktedonobacterales bacterium]